MPRRRRSKQPLLQIGFSLSALGLVLLWLPNLLHGSPVVNAALGGFRPAGKAALAFGLLLVGIHVAVSYFRTNGVRVLAQRKAPQQGVSRVGRVRESSGARPASTTIPPPLDRVWAAYRADSLDARDAARSGEATTGTETPTERPRAWSRDVFAAIEWRRFEAVCEKLFAQAGFRTRSHPIGADGGIDIWLYSKHSDGPVAIVQCKHWHEKPVPVRALREFLGVMTAEKIDRGTYATSSTFTRDALAFARDNGINAQDGDGLLQLISRRTPAQQAELLAVALEGDYWRPTCPSCNVKMARRTARKTGQAFWGCTNYPRCKFKLPLAAAGRQPGAT